MMVPSCSRPLSTFVLWRANSANSPGLGEQAFRPPHHLLADRGEHGVVRAALHQVHAEQLFELAGSASITPAG